MTTQKKELHTFIVETLTRALTSNTTFSLEHPGELMHGDYATNVALISAKELKINPKELAEKLASDMKEHMPAYIASIEIAGPGFINFKLSGEYLHSYITDIQKNIKSFGANEEGKGKKVLVEYSSPNIAKPFTVGHLRSTIIGDAIANLFAWSGYEVIRDNHLGDWGTQFGKLIVALQKWGDIERIKKSETPVKDLVELYIKFHDEAEKDETLEDTARSWFTKLEHGDKEARILWQECVNLSMLEFNRIYARLQVSTFDTLHGESFFEDKMESVLSDVREKGIGKESEGAYLIFFNEETKLPPLMLTKKDGSSLYALRDLATDKFRKETYGDDVLIVNEVGAEQSQYFKQIFEAEKTLGYFGKESRVHVGHGLYRFKDGKMSTRKGNVIWLDDILNEAEARASVINEDTKREVALAAIKFNDLKRDPNKDIVFDWDEMLTIEGDSGPYVQYTAVRAHSIVRKGEGAGIVPGVQKEGWETHDLERMLYRFPEIVSYAREAYAPQHVATYTLLLSRMFNSFYAQTQIVNKDDKHAPYRISLCLATHTVLTNALSILGIPVPEKM